MEREVPLIAEFVRHADVEQRRVLLRAEDVGIAGAAARAQAIDRELDRIAGIELDEIAERSGGAVELAAPIRASARARASRARTPPCREDHVEGDQVDAGVLAAHGLGELAKLARHRAPSDAGRRHVRREKLERIVAAQRVVERPAVGGLARSTSSSANATEPAEPFTSGRRA
jgi:hypothetical protein